MLDLFLGVQVSAVQPLCTLDTAEPIVVSLLTDHHTANSKLMPNATGPSSYRTPSVGSRNCRVSWNVVGDLVSGQLLELFGKNVVSEEAIDSVPFLGVLGKDSTSLHVSEDLVGGVLVVSGLVLPKTVVFPPLLRGLFVKLVWSKRVTLFHAGMITPQICCGCGEAGREDGKQGLAQVGWQKRVLRGRNQATDTVKCTVEQVETGHLCFYRSKNDTHHL